MPEPFPIPTRTHPLDLCIFPHGPTSFPVSNLAAVRLGLNKAEPALENAMEALRLDPAYAKGLYRKGQALMALDRCCLWN